MVWKNPLVQENMQVEPLIEPVPQQTGGGMDMGGGGSLPPMSSYGPMLPAWNEAMMTLLVDIEIPEDYMKTPLMKKVFIWSKKVLMQLQFGNYTSSIQKKMIKDLQMILFLGGQEGNEGLVAEAQFIFVANMQIYKGRSDMPDGIRERIAWIMGINKQVFSEDRPARPAENKGILGSIWGGGNR